MNSILQCLSSTKPLTKYFLFEIYKFHLNKTSKFGTKGKLAIAFADLIADLYIGEESSLEPWDIKRIISQKATQFAGFQQHDSQEMLSVLLETLHEDVNLIDNKPYIEHKDYPGLTDLEVSSRYWQNFKMRESSIFTDLFYGQLKSKLSCTQCGYSSLSFDAFNMLSLPIPNHKIIQISFRYIPFDITLPHYEFYLSINEYATLFELKKKLNEFFIKEPHLLSYNVDEWLHPFVIQFEQHKDRQVFEIVAVN